MQESRTSRPATRRRRTRRAGPGRIDTRKLDQCCKPRDILREDLGQTYTVSVGFAQSLPQRGDRHIQIGFGAAPDNVQAMIDQVLQEVNRIRSKGPSPT